MSQGTPFQLFLEKKTNVRIKKLSRARNNMQQFSIYKAKAISVDKNLVTNFHQENQQHQIRFDLSDYLNNKRLDSLNCPPNKSNHLNSFLTPVIKVKSHNHCHSVDKSRVPNHLWTLDPELYHPELEVSKINQPENSKKMGDQCPRFFNSTIQNRMNSKKKRLFAKIFSSELLNQQSSVNYQNPVYTEANESTAEPIETIETELEQEVVSKFLTAKYSDNSWIKLNHGPVKRRKRSILALSGIRNSDIKPWEVDKELQCDFYS